MLPLVQQPEPATLPATAASMAALPTQIPHLKQMLVDQVCAAAGGPCTYAGRDMVTAHKGMSTSGAEFGALVGDLVTSLDKFKVPEKEKGELLAALAGC